MKKLFIAGSGGFAREVLTLINAINNKVCRFDFAGFVSRDYKQVLTGYPIIASDEELNRTEEPISIVIAVGNPSLKKRIKDNYTNPLISFPPIIHPSVIVGDSSHVRIGDGSIICAGNILTTDISIGDFVTLNLGCTIGHDTIIQSYCSIMPGVNISGNVKIATSVFIGTGAKLSNGITIGKHSVVGAGSVVLENVKDCSKVVGVPAKQV